MDVTAYRLSALGWSEFFEEYFRPYAAQGYTSGRVALEHKGFYRVYTEYGDLLAEIAGKLRHEAANRADLPAAGDWVALRPRPEEGRATIHAILPRKSKFARKTAGERTEEQIVGANIDTVLLMMSLNQDFNLRRIERYLAVAWESGANPVVVLSKADLCADAAASAAEIQKVAAGVPWHAISVVTHEGLDALSQYFGCGQTVALLGSSGVGKSSLINHLLGREQLRVQEVREDDDRGRHTTTHRELILLPQGGLVLDTPGMRELQLWDAQEGVTRAFDEIEELASQCYFRNCQHKDEPRCAVREALETGALDEARYRNYDKLQRELRYLETKQDKGAQIAEKKKWKKLTRMATEWSKMKRRGY
jgi:ribosome biogenesis GTPase